MTKFITRPEAEDSGLMFYFTGDPCRYGHKSERYVSSGNCVECVRGNVPNNKAFKGRDLAVASNVRQRAADIEYAKELALIEREHGF